MYGRKNTSIKKLTVKKNNCITIIKTTQTGLKKKTIRTKLKLKLNTDKNCLQLVFPFKEEQRTICKRPFFVLQNILVPTNILLSMMFYMEKNTILNFASTCKKIACLYRSNIVQKSRNNVDIFIENYDSDLYENRVKRTLDKHQCPICKKFYQEVRKHVKFFHKNEYITYCRMCNKINGNNCDYCTICIDCIDAIGATCPNCCSCESGCGYCAPNYESNIPYWM